MIEHDETPEALYQAVGQLVLMASALDHQLSRICIAVFGLVETPFLEPVVGSLDSSRKVDMLKAYAQKLKPSDWKGAIRKHAEAVERLNQQRNRAAHSSMIIEHGRASLTSSAASKLLRSLDLERGTASRLRIADLFAAIASGEKALGSGETLIENLQRLADTKKSVRSGEL